MSNYTGLQISSLKTFFSEGLPKKVESFVFYFITDPGQFRARLKSIIPLITTTTQAKNDRIDIENHKHSGRKDLLVKFGTNIAFSQKGLNAVC